MKDTALLFSRLAFVAITSVIVAAYLQIAFDVRVPGWLWLLFQIYPVYRITMTWHERGRNERR